MYKYHISIPLAYNTQSNLEKYDFSSNIELKFKDKIEYTFCLELRNGDFISTEKCTILINNDDNAYSIEFDSLYADNESYAIEIATNLADKIVIVLSYITQSQNVNPHYFHTKFSYNLRNIKCAQQNYLKFDKFLEKREEINQTVKLILNDRINVTDSVHTEIIYSINVEQFNKIFNQISTNKPLNFMVECYYRSLGEIDFRSKYYNLFTVIEFIENEFKGSIDIKLILNNEQINKVMENINAILLNELDNLDYKQRMNSRLKQILSTATEKSRSEKLCDILSSNFGITKIKKGALEFEITNEFAKKLIDTRNDLFHGKEKDTTSLNELNNLTNKLLCLVEVILDRLLDKFN